MSSTVGTIAGASPQPTSNGKLARLAGLLYLSSLPTLGIGVFGAQSLLANGALSAAAQIGARQSFFELGVLLGTLGAVGWLIQAVLFNALFRAAGDRACKLMVVFMLACALLMLAAFTRRMDAISLVADSPQLMLGTDQLRTLAALAVRSSDNLLQASFIFSAVWLVPFGYLVIRSGFVPRILGVLLILGAPFYLLSFVAAVYQVDYASTSLARVIGIVSGVPEIVGELGVGFWLLIRGTNGGTGARGHSRTAGTPTALR